ncbi:hypothetical protein [Terriglobus sp. ADX1]|uniref:hypothetical protein n=1 Tax=Terriglobus sp. ADX1 TaxID=2794063 RepID=UPI002FE63360
MREAKTYYRICRHIRSNGDRCQSPRLLKADFCYFHNRLHQQHRSAIAPQRSSEVMLPVLDKSGTLVGMEPAPTQTLDLGPLEDRTSVQMAISTVLNALAAGRLEQSRATALLYGLQLASTNCVSRRFDHSYAVEPVSEVEVTPEGNMIAPEQRGR